MKPKFTEWLVAQVEDRGGAQAVCAQRGVTLAPITLARWMAGLAEPNLDSQLDLSQALGLSFEAVREAMGLPTNAFSSYLVGRIILRGTIKEFCLAADIGQPQVASWIDCNTLPRGSAMQYRIAEVVAEWDGIKAGSTYATYYNRVLADILEAVSGAVEKSTAKMISDPDSTKIEIPC